MINSFNDPMLLAASNGLNNIGVDDNNSPLNQLINVQLQHAQAMQQINQLAMLQGQQNTLVNSDLNQLQQLLQLQAILNGQNSNQNNVLGGLNMPFGKFYMKKYNKTDFLIIFFDICSGTTE